MPYLRSRNSNATGLFEINRRVATLLNCLEREINSAVVEGEITQDLQRFRDALLTRLEDEGWTFSFESGEKLKVRHPLHPHPFLRR